MSARDENAQLEEASEEVARAIWQTVLLSKDDAKARGLLGKATRRNLVTRILDLARAIRGQVKK